MEAFDEPLIRRFLGFLTPDNALVSISGPDIDGDRTEPVFGTAWRSGPALLPGEVDAPLELPGPNRYLPEDLDLALEPSPPGKPVRLATGTPVETWHAPDTEFRTPTARVDLQLRAATPYNPDDVVLATLHARLVEHAMNARFHAVGEAGLTHAVRPTWTGLRIYVGGYHDKLVVLFENALGAFVDPVLDAQWFAVTRTELAKGYANQKLGRPHEQVVDAVYRLPHPRLWLLGVRYYRALRTERQLGYVVQPYALPIARHPGIACVVQASKAGVEEVETRTRTFLDEQREWFRGLSEAELGEYGNGLVASLTRADGNNYDRVSRLVADLAARVLTFDERERLADAVARLGPVEVADTYDRLVDPARGNRLTVFSPGIAGTAARDGASILSIEAFRTSASSRSAAGRR